MEKDAKRQKKRAQSIQREKRALTKEVEMFKEVNKRLLDQAKLDARSWEALVDDELRGEAEA
eukprot:SAG22_NODE_13847_length_393_cov_0.717687_1_plen_61_part_01